MADVLTSVKPLLMLSRLVGLGPFSIDEEKRTFKLSIPGIVYSAIVLLLFSATSGYVVYEVILAKEKDKDKEAAIAAGAATTPATNESGSSITSVSDMIQKAAGIGVTICTILLTMIQRNKFIAVVNNFHLVNFEMVKLDIIIPYQKMLKYLQVELVALILLLVGLFLHDFFSWASIDKYHDVYYWIIYFVPNVFNFIMELQFISGALLLKKHYTLLNDYLIKFNEGDVMTVEDTKKVDVSVNNNGWMDNFDSHMGPKIMEQSFTAWDGSFSR